ncbi:MAG: hypothetical protein GKR97_01825 [Rhizobiaceae bacterium]|nr:hypothetical protein [Rhizobiaceae bacterium]
MYTLYWEYMAGSIVAHVMLEELGADYELRYVDMGAGEHKSSSYLSLVPSGRVPAIELPDGTTIGETAAIVTILGEQFPQSTLTPAQGEPDRANFLFWLNVMATSGYLTVARHGHPERYACSGNAILQVEQKARADLNDFFDVMNEAICGEPFFLPGGHTALDIYLTMLTEWSEDKAALFSSRPALAALAEATSRRPAYRAAMDTHHLPKQAA